MAGESIAAPGGPTEEEDEAAGAVSPVEILGFVRGAPRRHPVIAVLVFVIVAALGITISMIVPPVFVCDVKIVNNKNTVLGTLGNPGRSRDQDAPAKAVQDLLKRDNLISLIAEADLVKAWDRERLPFQRARDDLMRRFLPPPTDEDKVAMLIGVLEKRIAVTSDDTSISFAVQWHTPETAYRIVTALQREFFESKYNADVAMITDAISILETHAKEEQDKMDQALRELQTLEEHRGPPPAPLPSASAAPVASADPAAAAQRRQITVTVPGTVDPELRKLLDEKRRAIQTLEEDHQRQVAAMKVRLAELEGTLASAHPQVVAARRQLEALSDPPAELHTLKVEEQALVDRIRAAAESHEVTTTTTTYPGASQSSSRSDAGSAFIVVTDTKEDAATTLARSKLGEATKSYTEIAGRLESARLELDIAAKAFKYRYTIFKPAEMVRKPKSPNRGAIGGGAVVAALLLGFVIPAIVDMLGGKLIEAWQARSRLKLPLLGEVTPPPSV